MFYLGNIGNNDYWRKVTVPLPKCNDSTPPACLASIPYFPGIQYVN